MTTHISQNPHSSTSNADADFPRSRPMESSDEIDLRELLSVIWQGKWLIIAITTVFAVGSVIFAINQPNIYKAEALLAPASEEQGGSLSALASQFGGLASLAGVNLGSKKGTDKTELAIEVLKSRSFISEFIQKHNILPDLMAAKKWNRDTDILIYDEDDYLADTKTWIRDVKAPFKPEPSMQEAYKEFSKVFGVHSAKDTGMVKVSIEHISPNIAKQWVTWLVQDINKVMKERDVSEAQRSTEFLNKQISLTNVADIKTVLYKLIEEQAKTIMFAEVRDEYVFKTVDPAVAPEEKVKPKRVLICIVALIFGGMIGVVSVLIRYFSKK